MSAIEALASKFDVVIGENTELSKNALVEEQQLRTDIAAAWKVLEKLSERFECSTAVGREYPYRRMIYAARCVGGLLQYDNPDLKMWAFAETAALAVCRLALLAVLGDESQ